VANIEFIDTHTHLNMLEGGIEPAIQLAEEQQIVKMINIGTSMEDLPQVYAQAKQFYPKVYCTLGVHPHDAKTWDEKVKSFILSHARKKEVVALGEMGLDFFYNHSEHDVQKAVFREQIEMAIDENLPIEIHTRDAEKETIEILKSYKGQVKGLVHCFTGTQWLADEALDLGLNISISGVVTFKKAEELRSVVKILPLDRIHVETDAPFLSPVPQRGKKNTPAFTRHVADFVAELKGVSVEELSIQLKSNTLELFKKIQWS